MSEAIVLWDEKENYSRALRDVALYTTVIADNMTPDNMKIALIGQFIRDLVMLKIIG